MGVSGSGRQIEILDHGQIARVLLPPGWIESELKASSGADAGESRQFHPGDSPEVALCLRYRGAKLSAEAGRLFSDLVQQPIHKLSRPEIRSLKEILKVSADPFVFTLRDARTEDRLGKRVLIIEGRYNEDQKDSYEILIDAQGTGRVVQEISFLAPKADFARYLFQVRAALKSIQWK